MHRKVQWSSKIQFKYMISSFKWALKTAQQALYFSLVGLLTSSLRGLFYTFFSLLKPPTFLPLYSPMMTSHFMDKIEKSSSFHQTCNLHWSPFSLSLLWLKWKRCLSASQSSISSTRSLDFIPSNTVLPLVVPPLHIISLSLS